MKRLFGGILIATGILLMTTSGLCTGYLVISYFATGGVFDLWLALFPAIIGGVPMAVGAAFFTWGRSLLRLARAEAERPDGPA